MTYEVVIAPDRERAEAYAMEHEWSIARGIQECLIKLAADGDRRELRFVATPMALAKVPAGTRVHVAFTAGIPAAWAKALSRHSVVTEPA